MTTYDERLAVPSCPVCGTPENTPVLFCTNCHHLKGAEPNVRAATFLRRLAAYVLEFPLFIVTLGIGYIVWLVFTMANGQTPGKQLLGIRAVKVNGEPLGWGMTFVREILIKGVVLGILSNFLFGIIMIINYLFPLFDKNLQALHDKMVSSIVVKHDSMSATRSQIDTSDDPWGRQVESETRKQY